VIVIASTGAVGYAHARYTSTRNHAAMRAHTSSRSTTSTTRQRMSPKSMGTRHTVSPIHTPKVTVIPLPPCPRRNGENMWPSNGPTMIGRIAHPVTSPHQYASATGTNPFNPSRMTAVIPTTGPATRHA